MVKCNRERVKEFNSHFIATSDLEEASCEQNLVDADFLDFKNMENKYTTNNFYLKTNDTDVLSGLCVIFLVLTELQTTHAKLW